MQNSSSAGPAGPAPTPDLDRLLRGGGGEPGRPGGGGGCAASRGPGARPPPRPLCLSGSGCPRRAPRRRRPGRTRGRPGTHTPGIVLRAVRVQAGRGRGVPDPGPRRPDDASVFVLPELEGGLPSPGGRQPPAARSSSAGAPHCPPPARHEQPGALPQLRTTHPAGGRRAGAGLARDAGAVRPGPGLREGRAGRPGAAASGRERVRSGGGAAAAAGSSFVPAAALSVAGTRRSPGSGRREARGGGREGGGGRTGGRGG